MKIWSNNKKPTCVGFYGPRARLERWVRSGTSGGLQGHGLPHAPRRMASAAQHRGTTTSGISSSRWARSATAQRDLAGPHRQRNRQCQRQAHGHQPQQRAAVDQRHAPASRAITALMGPAGARRGARARHGLRGGRLPPSFSPVNAISTNSECASMRTGARRMAMTLFPARRS